MRMDVHVLGAVVHVKVHDPLMASSSRSTWITVQNKLGQPVVTPDLVVTIADDTGAAKGLASWTSPACASCRLSMAGAPSAETSCSTPTDRRKAHASGNNG